MVAEEAIQVEAPELGGETQGRLLPMLKNLHLAEDLPRGQVAVLPWALPEVLSLGQVVVLLCVLGEVLPGAPLVRPLLV